MAKILRLDSISEDEHRQIGRIHPDGSITFRDRCYRALREVPADCRGLRLDVASHRQWRAIYRQIDPHRRHPMRGRGTPPAPAV